MKKTDWFLLVSAGLYSWLFYQQTPGLNGLLFTTALVTFSALKDTTVIKNKSWLLSALGSLVSACAVLYYGNVLSFIANCISLLALGAFSLNNSSSFLVSLIMSAYSSIASVVFLFIRWLDKMNSSGPETEKKPFHVKFLVIYLPVIIAILFFIIYRGANPLFYRLTEKIDLSFISMNWIVFTGTGVLLMYGFFHQQLIPALYKYDKNAPDRIEARLIPGQRWLGISAEQEWSSGVILLALLNFLLLVVNSLDLVYMWLSTELPEGMTHSEFVHQGSGLLITSIVIAISIILFYFRGDLNFFRGSKALKILAMAWIIQNVLLVISTAFRNQLYIEVYSLTYKRIGVYVYLLLTCIGLVTTFIKLHRVKSNWFLFRVNGWVFYAALVAGALVNWDRTITEFNIRQSENYRKELDRFYLLGLAPSSLPALVKNSGANSKDLYFENQLDQAVNEFLVSEKNKTWQSYSIENSRIVKELQK